MSDKYSFRISGDASHFDKFDTLEEVLDAIQECQDEDAKEGCVHEFEMFRICEYCQEEYEIDRKNCGSELCRAMWLDEDYWSAGERKFEERSGR